MNSLPIFLGFLAGISVLIGSLIISKLDLNRTTLSSLGALTSGILAYLALDTGSDSIEIITDFLNSKEIFNFILGSSIIFIAVLLVFIILAIIDKSVTRTSLVVSTGLGVHNIGEGFAIAAALLSGSVSSAIAFTIGFAIHNATEGIAISSPALVQRRKLTLLTLIGLSLMAGMPTTLGASIYYLGVVNQIFLALLDAIASASLVFVMMKVSILVSSLLGGLNWRFWTWFFIGVSITFLLESILTFFSNPY